MYPFCLQTFGTEKWWIGRQNTGLVVKHSWSKAQRFLGNYWKPAETGCTCLHQSYCFCKGCKCTRICLGFSQVLCTPRDMSLLLEVGWEWRTDSDVFFCRFYWWNQHQSGLNQLDWASTGRHIRKPCSKEVKNYWWHEFFLLKGYVDSRCKP